MADDQPTVLQAWAVAEQAVGLLAVLAGFDVGDLRLYAALLATRPGERARTHSAALTCLADTAEQTRPVLAAVRETSG